MVSSSTSHFSRRMLKLHDSFTEMAPYLKLILAESSSILTPASQSSAKSLLEKLETANKTSFDKLAEKLAEAEKNEGETEISDALRAKANYFTKIGDKVTLAYRIYKNQLPANACVSAIRKLQSRHKS